MGHTFCSCAIKNNVYKADYAVFNSTSFAKFKLPTTVLYGIVTRLDFRAITIVAESRKSTMSDPQNGDLEIPRARIDSTDGVHAYEQLKGWMYKVPKIGPIALPWYASPKIQILLVALVCFLCPGMFNVCPDTFPPLPILNLNTLAGCQRSWRWRSC